MILTDTPPASAAATVATDHGFMTDYLRQSAEAMTAFAQDEASRNVMIAMATQIVRALENGGRLLIAGNGGSAADAQHIAGEFTARLMYDRRPLSAVALTTDSSALTAIGNDYSFADIFSRQVLALGRAGDVFLGITTSGRSVNILRAFEAAREAGLVTAAFAGHAGVQGAHCDVTLAVPARWTPVIQQLHITAAHIVCGLVERALCPRPVGA